MKKIFIIITILLIFSAIVFGAYFAWQKSKEILTPPVVEQSSLPGKADTFESAIKPKLKIISDQPIFDYWLSASATTSEIFYLNQDGQIFKLKEDDKDELISDREFGDLQAFEANKKGDKILIGYGRPDALRFEIFDLKTKIWQPFQNASAAAFSPEGNKIAYLEHPNSALQMQPSELVIKDLAGAKPKTVKILSFNQQDYRLKWLTSEKILLIPKPSAAIISEIWQIDIAKKTLSPFISGQGLMVNFAKDNSWGLKFSVNNQREARLELIDFKAETKANLDFSTLADKCSIAAAAIYCAVPKGYSTVKAPILPDDYLKKAVYFDDAIYQINLKENTLTEIFTEAQPVIDAINFNSLGNQLLFINRYDNKLYRLELQR